MRYHYQRKMEVETISTGEFLKIFCTGGIICLIGQILIDFTKLTPPRILVIFVVAGALLTAFGLYEPIVSFGKNGATVPLPGFGYSLAKGVISTVKNQGLIGVLTGGITETAAGVAAAIFFGYVISLIFNPKAKS